MHQRGQTARAAVDQPGGDQQAPRRARRGRPGGRPPQGRRPLRLRPGRRGGPSPARCGRPLRGRPRHHLGHRRSGLRRHPGDPAPLVDVLHGGHRSRGPRRRRRGLGGLGRRGPGRRHDHHPDGGGPHGGHRRAPHRRGPVTRHPGGRGPVGHPSRAAHRPGDVGHPGRPGPGRAVDHRGGRGGGRGPGVVHRAPAVRPDRRGDPPGEARPAPSPMRCAPRAPSRWSCRSSRSRTPQTTAWRWTSPWRRSSSSTGWS